MIRSNAHTHTTWCDGLDTTDIVAQAAFELGFTDLGFSSHAPSPRDAYGGALQDEAGYRADIARLKKEYAGRMGILCGVEKDFYDEIDPALYDYVIGDLHFFEDADGTLHPVDTGADALRDTVNELYRGDPLAAVADFYRLSAENVRRFRPDIVGHYDLIAKFNQESALFDEGGAAYQSIALEHLDVILDPLRDYGGMMEMNFAVFARGLRDVPYPAPFLLRHMARRGARVIVTSDSHRASTLNAGFEAAPAFLRQAGFDSMAVLRDGKFIDVKIDG